MEIKANLENCSIDDLKYLAASCYMSYTIADIKIYTKVITLLEERLDGYDFVDFLFYLEKLADIRRQCTPRKKEF